MTGAVSALEATIESGVALAARSNLKITVSATPLGNPDGEIHGKVLPSAAGTPTRSRLRLSSVTPELKTRLTALRRE